MSNMPTNINIYLHMLTYTYMCLHIPTYANICLPWLTKKYDPASHITRLNSNRPI